MSGQLNDQQQNIKQRIEKFKSLCADGEHLEAEAIFEELPEKAKCKPPVALRMAKSLEARSLHVKAGKILSNALQVHKDNKPLGIRFIAHLIHKGNAGDVAERIEQLGQEIEITHALVLAKAFEKNGEIGLALKTLTQAIKNSFNLGDGRNPKAERYYAKLLVVHDSERAFTELSRMRDENKAFIYPEWLLVAHQKILRAKLYGNDSEGARDAIDQYASLCGASPSIDQLCVIANDWVEVGDTGKAKEYLVEVTRRLSELEEISRTALPVRLLCNLSRMLEIPISDQLVEKIVLQHLRDIKSESTSNLVALVDFSYGVVRDDDIHIVLSELLERPLSQSELFFTLTFATLLGDAVLKRRIIQKLTASPQMQDGKEVSLKQAGFIQSENLGLTGYRSDSNQAMLIFSSLVPKALWSIVALLRDKNISPIIVHDFQRNLSLSGLGPHPESFSKSVSELKTFIKEQGFAKVHTIGFSGGGLGALLYADALSAATCLVFSPPSYVPACDDSNDIRGLSIRRRIEKLNLLGISDVPSRFATSGKHPQTHVYYPSHSEVDVHHAERLRPFQHVTMFPQEDSAHSFWRGWESSRWHNVIDGLL